MKIRFQTLFILTALLTVLTAAGSVPPEKMESGTYLRILRQRRHSSTCGIFKGTAQHQRRGGELLTLPVRFAVLLAPERTTGQVIFDGKSGFIIGQELKSDNAVSTVVPMPGSAEQDLAGYMGIRASDLAMAFVFWKEERELEPERVSLIPCRVFLLHSPDGAEKVKLYCATQYFFPLKAEFFKSSEKDFQKAVPQRTVEVSAFGEKNGLYYARTLRFSGPGWRTRIDFSQEDAVVEVFDEKNPRQLFLPSLKMKE